MPPWTSIGKLQATAGSLRLTCTGARIGPDLVLSAAHCLFNPRTQRYFAASSLHFVAGLAGAVYSAAVSGAALEPAPGYNPANPGDTRGSDWALVVLASPPTDAVPSLPLLAGRPSPGQEVMVGGWAQDNPNVLTADNKCHVTGYAVDGRGRTMIVHDCAATHGVSGAPLLSMTAGKWSIVGINVATVRGGVGLAVPLDEVRSTARVATMESPAAGH